MNRAHGYEVQVRNRVGEISNIYVEADSVEDLYKQVAERHLVVLDVKESLLQRFFIRSRGKTVKKREIRDLFYQTGVYLNAGLPLERLFSILSKREKNEKLKHIIDETHRGLRSGKSLSDLLEGYPNIFPRYMTASIKAGEESGDLAETLLELARLIDKEINLRDSFISSLTYPTILFLTAVISLFLIIYFAVPRFAQIFDDMNREMPLILNLMFGISSHFWISLGIFLFIVAGLFVGVIYLLEHDERRQRIDEIILGLPRLGEVIILFQLTLVFRILGVALKSALPIDRALDLAQSVLKARPLKELFNAALLDIRKGGRLTASLSEAPWMPEVVTNLLGVAEESGKMDEMSIKVAEIMEEDLDKQLKRLITLAEPLMILGVSFIIGGVIISLLYSLFSINF